MTMQKKVVALLGSTRMGKTCTESIVDYLKDRLAIKNTSFNKFMVTSLFNNPEQLSNFIAELKSCDVFLICSPVFVHSLPYPVTYVLEELAEKTDKDFWENKQMLSIIHNGYPKPIQRQSSIEICENFADQMGIEWLGGVGFGGSPIIDGRPLEEVGGYTKWMRRCLDELSKSILEGTEVTEEAQRYEKKHFFPIPLWILKILMNMMIKKQARDNGVDIYEQPYLSD